MIGRNWVGCGRSYFFFLFLHPCHREIFVEQLGDYFHMLSGCPVPAVRILGVGWILSGSEAEPWLDWVVCFWLMVLIIYLMVDHFRSFFLTWSLAPHVLIGVEAFFFFSLGGALWNTIWPYKATSPSRDVFSTSSLFIFCYLNCLVSSPLFGLLLFLGNW
ncbi:hypothetical protein HOY82DRAFT_413688 [Tuber indicum]|nr:hypothetical protein HOY82DRAFT_413688 [Tuber indicum]